MQEGRERGERKNERAENLHEIEKLLFSFSISEPRESKEIERGRKGKRERKQFPIFSFIQFCTCSFTGTRRIKLWNENDHIEREKERKYIEKKERERKTK